MDKLMVAPWELPEPERTEFLRNMKAHDLHKLADRAFQVADEQKAKLKRLCKILDIPYEAL